MASVEKTAVAGQVGGMTPFIFALVLTQSAMPSPAAMADRAAAVDTASYAGAPQAGVQLGMPGAALSGDAVQAVDPFEAAMRFAEGDIDGEFVPCIPAQNADAHLHRAAQRLRQAMVILGAEIQSGRAGASVRRAYDILSDDGEMQLGRYMVQVLVEKSCQD